MTFLGLGCDQILQPLDAVLLLQGYMSYSLVSFRLQVREFDPDTHPIFKP